MLEKYGEKRSFEQTPEPPPERRERGEGPLTFVIQKHAARRLHYDFRLEVDGVLVSWAVPKGPSLNPREKRLAVHVEDHPLDYASFEGIIPKGNYGAGEVIVWDCGTYSPDEGSFSFLDRVAAQERMQKGLAAGKLSITLRGSKLKGSWTLVKTARAENDWLLIKHKDAYVSEEREILEEDQSVYTGLTIEDLKAGLSNDPAAKDDACVSPQDAAGSRKAAFPSSVSPMLASLTDSPFSGRDWIFEPKLDGVRIISLINNGKVKLLSRRGLDATAQYPSLALVLAQQPADEMVLDGEVVALDERGSPSFQVLQQRINLTRPEDIRRMEAQIPVYYYVFDLLYLDSYDLRAVPLVERKALLEKALLPTERVMLLEHFEEDGVAAFRAALDNGLEGVVAKRRDSLYEGGRHSRHWLKIKNVREDDFIIGGYSQGQGSRAKTFGALLLGQFDEERRLVYAGHVGTGFDDARLDELRGRLGVLATDDCPFAAKPPLNSPTTWVRPELVAEVKFAERTQDGILRAPVFLRLREDKPPRQVHRAVIVPTPAGASADSGSAAPSGKEAHSILEQLEGSEDKLILRVEGERISLNNLNKTLWPAMDGRRALTKRDYLVYLAKVAPYMLPHLRDRVLSLIRFPEGIHGQRFFQKHYAHKLPGFVERVNLFTESEGDQEYMVCNNLPTLLWLGQLAVLELHTWYSRTSPEPDGHHLRAQFTGSVENIESSLLNYPDFIVFDLDPYIYSGAEARGEEPQLNRKAFEKTCQVARWLKELLDSLSLSAFIKTTGRTGLHIYAPIIRELDYDAARSAAETVGQFLMRQHAKEITMQWVVDKRTGKVFFDHNQNVRGKTLASVYSARASAEATVSAPVRWEEIDEIYPTDFTILDLPDRLAKTGDLWKDILNAKHDLKGLLATAGTQP